MARRLAWLHSTYLVECDLRTISEEEAIKLPLADAVIHLAWGGLPNFHSLHHIEENLPASYRFLKMLILRGDAHVLVAGTCLEYGFRFGCLNEDLSAEPVVAYAVAKDSLRRHLEQLALCNPFRFVWARLFYTHGAGQNPKSLLAQLDQAIDRGDRSFDMSKGNQLRDYLPVEGVAKTLVALVEKKDCSGIFNVCSGKPISVREMAEARVQQRGAAISLNLGRYDYPPYEPLAFWGDTQKLKDYGIRDEY
jgi:dTDP-6-deoxy-L-talose 4-dehydrogenase (NAD+)